MFRAKFLSDYVLGDIKSNFNKLIFVIISHALGLGILIALVSYNRDFSRGIEKESKSLLGADLAISKNSPFTDDYIARFNNFETSREVTFTSLIYMQKSNSSRLIQVRAISGSFPYYGETVIIPNLSLNKLLSDPNKIVIDKSIAEQLNLIIDDEVLIGAAKYKIGGILESFPGEAYSRTMIVPKVFINFDSIKSTELLKKGSRVSHKIYFKTDNENQTNGLISELTKEQSTLNIELDTVEDKKKRLDKSTQIVSQFLILLSIITVILGTLGLTSILYSIIKDQIPTASMLRCLGATTSDVIKLLLIEITLISATSSVLGAFVSLIIQQFLSRLLTDFLPISFETNLYWDIILIGILLSLLSGILASLISLIPIINTSPLQAIRLNYEQDINQHKKLVAAYFFFIITFVFLGTYAIAKNYWYSAIFTGFIISSFLFISLGYFLSAKFFKIFKPRNLGFAISYAINGLNRVNSQAKSTVITLSLTTAIFVIILTTRSSILNQFKESGSVNRPNMILFDVQLDQVDQITNLLSNFKMPLIEKAPIVTMRLESINGIKNLDLRKNKNIPEWTLKREYRSTYRNNLIESEEITEGKFVPTFSSDGTDIPVTVDSNLAKDLNIKLNDKIIFDVQGVKINCYISGIRKINWRRIQTNFFFLFPEGTLESAPQFLALMTKTSNSQNTANFQSDLLLKHPNVSAIDLNLILDTADKIIAKIILVIEFLAIFSLLSGLLILMASISTTRLARIREICLLKTLGSTESQIINSTIFEFLLLGLISTIIGTSIGLISSIIICFYSFDIPLNIPFVMIGGVLILEILLVIIVGMSLSYRICKIPAVQILRYS